MTLERLYRRRVPSSAPLSERRMTAERLLRHFRVCGLMVEERAYGTLVSAPDCHRRNRHPEPTVFPTPAKILKTILDPPPDLVVFPPLRQLANASQGAECKACARGW